MNSRSHPLLEQVPLTVSPFIKLPQATTLPYTYRAMPSSLPPSSTSGNPSTDDHQQQTDKPRYVVSGTGHAAHPDDIVASCRALQAHVAKLQSDAEAELRALDERIRARELAEKRRVAPGWLDSEARILEPERKLADGMEGLSLRPGPGPGQEGGPSEMAAPDHDDPGAELDRVFGGK
ncbi:hypothetical protein PpBr36_01970 [Pyricularia pennisetigena]|uniref:hypothetical protein n=1 Tax=Pyricularia pennisetigena TaxID=1578925 RepID=UPI0011547C65|nr:hypothetical protein PpBr36_01970 [Pyricularia pennisetigena]TLS29484.1 hypothetical protein PpBr36_01970 [Pyricularia pennisetigena]